LREKKEELEPQFILRAIQAEVLFLRSALQHAEQCEAAIRKIGPVSPIRYSGWGGLGSGGSYSAPTSTNTTSHYEYEEPSHLTSAPSIGGLSLPAPSGYAQPPSAQARAIYPFQAGTPQELSFQPGDVLNILNFDGAWWQAELRGQAGLIPSNYVERI